MLWMSECSRRKAHGYDPMCCSGLGRLTSIATWLRSGGLGTPKWIVYIVENPLNMIKIWMIWGYSHSRKPPSVHVVFPQNPDLGPKRGY
jgi:hypothetical protein